MEAKKIKKLREVVNITQLGMAERLGVSKYTVSRWERGVTKPSPLALKQLVEFSKEMWK